MDCEFRSILGWLQSHIPSLEFEIINSIRVNLWLNLFYILVLDWAGKYLCSGRFDSIRNQFTVDSYKKHIDLKISFYLVASFAFSISVGGIIFFFCNSYEMRSGCASISPPAISTVVCADSNHWNLIPLVHPSFLWYGRFFYWHISVMIYIGWVVNILQ